MKKSKLLSLFLVLVILFSSVPVGAVDLEKINESLNESVGIVTSIDKNDDQEIKNYKEEEVKTLENEVETDFEKPSEKTLDEDAEADKSDITNNEESSEAKLEKDVEEESAKSSEIDSADLFPVNTGLEKTTEDSKIVTENTELKKLELDDLEERINLLSKQLAEENNYSNIKEIIDKEVSDTAKFMLSMVPEPVVGTLAGEWTVLSLARSGEPVPENYFEDYYKRVEDYVEDNEGELHRVKYTEYSRVIVALTSIGKDPRDVAGYDLVKPLSNYDKVKRQGINGPIWALIALDTKDFEISDINDPNAQNSRDVMIKDILDSEVTSTGGWNLFRDKNGNTDPDITAMALYALAPYENRPEVKAAIERGVQALSDIQLPTGGYTTMGDENSESSAQVIIALTTLGIDPHRDERFIKNGNSVVDALLTYKAQDGGYKHIHSEATANAMGTDQAMEALIGLKRFYEGKNALFDMSDEKIDDSEVNPNPVDEDLSKNKKELEEIIELAEKIKKADYISDDGKDIYTNETWVTKDIQNQLEQEILNSKKILDKKDVTNKEISDSLENLRKAIKDYNPKFGTKIRLKDETLSIGVANPVGGTISPSGIVKYSEDSPVTLRFTPDFDYELDYVTVDNKFFQYSDRLTLPNKDIKEGSVISAVFRKKATNRIDTPKKSTKEVDRTKRDTVKNNNDQTKLIDNTKYIVIGCNYSDIKNHWAETSINYVTAKGFFKGVGENKFEPDGILTRAMMVTILGRLDGISEANTNTAFYDVDSNSYYAAHVAWALKNGITDGTGKGTFSPDKPITREEMAKLFDSFLQYKNIEFDEVNKSYISDKLNISSWALDSVEKMYKAGVLKGTPDGSFKPKDFSTRAQLATVIYNIDTQISISSKNKNSQPKSIKLEDKVSNISNPNTINGGSNTLDGRRQEEDLRKKLEDESNRKKKEEERRREEERKIKERAIIESSKGPKDKYMTDPTPAGRPKPVEPGTEEISSETKTATLSIRCDTILNNMDRLNEEKIPYVPKDGTILRTVQVQFHPGESVYDVIKRETADRGIHMESTFTPMYNSAYIEGINNLYEFDCGELSGWMYKVNGWFPNYGCSRYLVKEGDVIEWVYTCDLGRDVGDNSMMK